MTNILNYTQSHSYSQIIPDTFNKESNSLDEKIAMCKLEYENYKLEGFKHIPTKISDEQWIDVASMKSFCRRKKYFRYLYVTENCKLNDAKKSAIRKQSAIKLLHERLDAVKKFEEGNRHLVYGLWGNCIMNKIGTKRMNAFYDKRVLNAKLFGQQLIFDGSFVGEMNTKEQKNAAKQLAYAFKINRSNPIPFYIHLCNFDLDHHHNIPLTKAIQNIGGSNFVADIHLSNYLEIFDKNKLVYLSPHAEEELDTYDHEAVYIIGHLVDLGPTKTQSFDKAKKEGIKVKRFPLER